MVVKGRGMIVVVGLVVVAVFVVDEGSMNGVWWQCTGHRDTPSWNRNKVELG